MFEVGFTELLLIFALALLVLGPQKLPKLAQQVGRWVGRARAMARQFRDQLEEEAHNIETKVSIDPDIDTSLEEARGAHRYGCRCRHDCNGDSNPPPKRAPATPPTYRRKKKISIRPTITCMPIIAPARKPPRPRPSSPWTTVAPPGPRVNST